MSKSTRPRRPLLTQISVKLESNLSVDADLIERRSGNEADVQAGCVDHQVGKRMNRLFVGVGDILCRAQAFHQAFQLWRRWTAEHFPERGLQ